MKTFLRIGFVFAWIFVAVVVVGGIVFYASGSFVYAPEARGFEDEQQIARESTREPFELAGEAQKVKPQGTILLFTGDVMLGRHVERLMKVNGEDYPFEDISAFLQKPHFTFVNLEGPIVYDHSQTPDFSTSFSFSEDKAKVLKKHGVDAVALGNNHTLDRGQNGYEETKAILGTQGMFYVGHATEMGKEYALSQTVNNVPMNFLSFNVTFPFNDEDEAVETVRSVASSSDDLLIVNIHWGSEYQLESNAAQQELAHRIIDAGADVIIGHHPHVTQEIELYNDKLIFYSLGNFIFDQYFSVDVQESYALSLLIENEDLYFRIHPLQSKNSQVRLMDHDYMTEWLERLADRSSSELREQILKRTIFVE